jgi:hypothetical protein
MHRSGPSRRRTKPSATSMLTAMATRYCAIARSATIRRFGAEQTADSVHRYFVR